MASSTSAKDNGMHINIALVLALKSFAPNKLTNIDSVNELYDYFRNLHYELGNKTGVGFNSEDEA